MGGAALGGAAPGGAALGGAVLEDWGLVAQEVNDAAAMVRALARKKSRRD